ncbi:MAG: dienelactone hydrolase family protein [Planctomycetes bacterium]|nr:dienelactone hydrolase family protein [Planctomycetota bacterium]
MRIENKKLGGLTTRVIDALPEDTGPSLAVVLCHGFGAPGGDLVPFAPAMLDASGKLAGAARFYFPEGPLDLSSIGMWGSRAWWMIDMDAIQRAMADNTFRERARNDRPEGMLEARGMVTTLIEEVKDDTGLATSRIALGGFSQGGMVTMDVAYQLEENPAALMCWSGTLLNEDEWRERGKLHHGMKVLQSHGRQDPLLSYAWAEDLRDVLIESGADVEFLPFDGPHTIPEEGLSRAVMMLESALD